MVNGQGTQQKAERFPSTFRPNERQIEEHRWNETVRIDEIIIPTSTEAVATEIHENINSK